MRPVRWIVVALASAALLGGAACSAGTGPGGGADPREALTAGAESLAPGGSAQTRATFSFPGTPGPGTSAEGTISWQGAGGTTGELRLPSPMNGQPTRSLFTEDALYVETGPIGLTGSPALAGKKWLKQSYAGFARDLGPLGEVFTAAISQTNPVRSAALLVQSPDLREVGTEQVNGVAATHYSGTIRFADAVEDLRLGLSREVLDELRREIAATGVSDAQQYDIWVDDQGRPVRAQGRTTGDPAGPASYSVDYTGYAGPKPVVAPPANEVLERDELYRGLGGN